MAAKSTWITTFTRFRPGRIPLIGPIIVIVADWSRPQPGHGPMFDGRLLERLSCAHPGWIVGAHGTLSAALLWYARQSGQGLGTIAGRYALGLLVWTLVEYLAHRVSFHHAPTTTRQVAYGYVVHGVHHAYPDDSRRWVLPLTVTVPIAAALVGLAWLATGPAALSGLAGFIHGYLAYDLLHYFIHRGHMPTRLGRYLRQYHLQHHYSAPDRHFGVSSPLWDVVFRTR
jgi:sterol desaturase/sphingolipid hydroxylase (fatty acid hydroxylase superfamily)